MINIPNLVNQDRPNIQPVASPSRLVLAGDGSCYLNMIEESSLQPEPVPCEPEIGPLFESLYPLLSSRQCVIPNVVHAQVAIQMALYAKAEDTVDRYFTVAESALSKTLTAANNIESGPQKRQLIAEGMSLWFQLTSDEFAASGRLRHESIATASELVSILMESRTLGRHDVKLLSKLMGMRIGDTPWITLTQDINVRLHPHLNMPVLSFLHRFSRFAYDMKEGT